MSNDLLDALLSAVAGELENPKTGLTEANLFDKENEEVQENEKGPNLSLIHNGDTDSSDDEGNRNYENTKYNESGRDIKYLLSTSGNASQRESTSKNEASVQKSDSVAQSSNWNKRTYNGKNVAQLAAFKKDEQPQKSDVYMDPIFGLRITKPLISSSGLKERMAGREAIPIHKIAKIIHSFDTKKDWVVAGVVCSKSALKTSQNGNQYIVLTLSDLIGDIKTIGVFLFKGACKEYWKTTPGTVIGILNPMLFDKNNSSKDEVQLSVHNSQTIMILGTSKDLGTCKSMKKNGDSCTNIVNKSVVEFCTYHIKSEYQKCSLRSELQSNFAGKGLTELRNKVLGKNEVFYAGKSYMAIPAKKSKKLETKDRNRLGALNGETTTTLRALKPKENIKKSAVNLDVPHAQRMRDFELLKKLGVDTTKFAKKETFTGGHSAPVTLEESKNTAINVIAKLKAKNSEKISPPKPPSVLDKYPLLEGVEPPKTTTIEPQTKQKPVATLENMAKKDVSLAIPFLSSAKKEIDLNSVIIPRQKDVAKLNALKYIQRNGPIAKINPNSTKGTASKSTKRSLATTGLVVSEEVASKRAKIQDNEFMSDRFKKMMAAQSNHMDLLQQRDDNEKDKYFAKQEARERMEEKMTSTYKMACKAVRCTVCKYTSFSASEKCKEERHRLKVYDAVKRFFKCGHCQFRTVCLEVVPTFACKNCGSGKWERTTMMKEKTIGVTHALSIRGFEENNLNSFVKDANINLLVPDTGTGNS